MGKSILVLHNSFWNHSGHGMSGGDQMLIQILKRVRNNFEQMWCLTNIYGASLLKKDIEDAKYITSPAFFDSFGLFISYILRAILSFRCVSLKPDIIYSSSDFFPDVIPAFLLKKLRPETVWVQCIFHIYPDWRTRPGSKTRALVGQYLQKVSLILAKNSDLVININSQVRKYLIDRGFDDSRITINPPGIDIGYMQNIKPAPHGRVYDGVYLGRLSPSKGIYDLLDIWQRVVNQIPDAILGVIGGGDDFTINSLKSLIAERGLEKNINLLGYITNDTAFSILKNSKVFLFPSHEEGFGIVIVESMITRVPVVAWDLEVFDEYFRDAIYMVKRFDFDMYAKVCADILEDRKTDIRDKIDYGVECANGFDWVVVSQKFMKALLSVIDKRDIQHSL